MMKIEKKDIDENNINKPEDPKKDIPKKRRVALDGTILLDDEDPFDTTD